MHKILYIVDIKKKQTNQYKLNELLSKDTEILSLTPYSCYLLDQGKHEYKTFHSIVSIEEFSNIVFKDYEEIESFFNTFDDYAFLFKDIAMVKTYEIYLQILFSFIKMKKNEKMKIVYITDAFFEKNYHHFNFSSNNMSGLYYCKDIDQFISINNKDTFFYILMKLKKNIQNIIYSEKILFKLLRHIKYTKSIPLYYEHINFEYFWKKKKNIHLSKNIDEENYHTIIKKLKQILHKNNTFEFILISYHNIFEQLKKEIVKNKDIDTLELRPFVYLSDYASCITNLLYKYNNIPRVFWQHGSYLHEHIFLSSREINVADINLVCNEYTKQLFLQKGGTNVYNVGSINFNLPISEREKVFDYLYIINNMHYSWAGTYLDSKSAFYSMDGNNLYQRHKEIIELFGVHFKNQKICIKMQSQIVDQLLYVPLLELSNLYPNVTIEFFIPIKNLIAKSRYIISDYFSSEFISRAIHYQKDIILFQESPTPLPTEILDDMHKMFILVKTVADLKEKVANMDKITINRKRYDTIIEYYSSKNCNTKKKVLEILENLPTHESNIS